MNLKLSNLLWISPFTASPAFSTIHIMKHIFHIFIIILIPLPLFLVFLTLSLVKLYISSHVIIPPITSLILITLSSYSINYVFPSLPSPTHTSFFPWNSPWPFWGLLLQLCYHSKLPFHDQFRDCLHSIICHLAPLSSLTLTHPYDVHLEPYHLVPAIL
jgi:hypothetical protein